jgi:hypothetical protein
MLRLSGTSSQSGQELVVAFARDRTEAGIRMDLSYHFDDINQVLDSYQAPAEQPSLERGNRRSFILCQGSIIAAY